MLAPYERLARKIRRRQPRRAARCHPLICLVRGLRREARLTMRDVAQGSGVCAPLSDIERGANTTLTTAFKLAAFFGKPVEELWKLLPAPPPVCRGGTGLSAVAAQACLPGRRRQAGRPRAGDNSKKKGDK